MAEDLITGRIEHIRSICQNTIEHDKSKESNSFDWTDRHWLAQSVLNILDGKIDSQITGRVYSDHACPSCGYVHPDLGSGSIGNRFNHLRAMMRRGALW